MGRNGLDTGGSSGSNSPCRTDPGDSRPSEGVVDLPDVLLESGPIFPQVMPKPGQIRPVTAIEWLRESICQFGDFSKVLFQRMKFVRFIRVLTNMRYGHLISIQNERVDPARPVTVSRWSG